MADKQIKVSDALEMVAKNLGDIKVPGSMIMDIGVPIGMAINDLTECVNALRRAEREAQEKEEAEIVDVESGIEGGGKENGSAADVQ